MQKLPAELRTRWGMEMTGRSHILTPNLEPSQRIPAATCAENRIHKDCHASVTICHATYTEERKKASIAAMYVGKAETAVQTLQTWLLKGCSAHICTLEVEEVLGCTLNGHLQRSLSEFEM